jgi:hypothetical protein
MSWSDIKNSISMVEFKGLKSGRTSSSIFPQDKWNLSVHTALGTDLEAI